MQKSGRKTNYNSKEIYVCVDTSVYEDVNRCTYVGVYLAMALLCIEVN